MSKGTNCGLIALEQMTALKSVSMFTLLHLARDNGLNLYFCKVEPGELMEVQRPAIFHQKDHFVFVEDGKPLPPGEYDGYVLTPKPIHEPLPHTFAKTIRGKKNAMGFLGPILTGVASIINPVLGAAVGAGFGGMAAAKSGEWWRIPLGAATGYLQGVPGGSTLGIGNSTLAAGLAAAGEIPGAVKSGNWMAPITAGVGQYMGAQLIGGAKAGMAGAAPGFMNQVIGAGKGMVNTVTSGIKTLTGGGGGGGGVEIAKNAATVGTTPAGYGGTYTVPGIGNSVVGTPGVSGPIGMGVSAIPTNAVTSAASNAASSGGGAFDIGKLLSGGGGNGGGLVPGMSNWQLMGAGLTSMMPQPKLQENSLENYTKAAQYLGGENYNALPNATREQLQKYTAMPLNDLATQFVAQDDKGMRLLEEKHKQERDALMAGYANYGQDPYTSSQAQQKLTEIDRQYDQAKAEYQQQIQNAAMDKAIQFKQQMLQNAMNQGQFDYNAAMELATYIGRDQELQYAIQSKNQEALQQVLAEIFSIGQYAKR